MKKIKPDDSQSFQDAYQELGAALQRLQSAQEEDLDTMIQCVEQAVAARQVCQKRLTALKKLLDKHFEVSPE